MLNAIRTLLERYLPDDGAGGSGRQDALFQTATAALLFEVAWADSHISESERATVQRIISACYGLTVEQAAAISDEAERSAAGVTSVFPFTRLLAGACSMEERIRIVSGLWAVAFSDGRLDVLEEHLIRRVADLLYVPHSEFIRTKLTHSGEL